MILYDGDDDVAWRWSPASNDWRCPCLSPSPRPSLILQTGNFLRENSLNCVWDSLCISPGRHVQEVGTGVPSRGGSPSCSFRPTPPRCAQCWKRSSLVCRKSLDHWYTHVSEHTGKWDKMSHQINTSTNSYEALTQYMFNPIKKAGVPSEMVPDVKRWAVLCCASILFIAWHW